MPAMECNGDSAEKGPDAGAITKSEGGMVHTARVPLAEPPWQQLPKQLFALGKVALKIGVTLSLDNFGLLREGTDEMPFAPFQPSHVTPESMTKCLQHQGVIECDVAVVAVKVKEFGAGVGLASAMCSVQLQYSRPSPTHPPSLIAKVTATATAFSSLSTSARQICTHQDPTDSSSSLFLCA